MTLPLVENILAQPEAIRTVAAYQFGEGKDALLASSALLRSRRIILSGMGGSLSACIPVAHYLASKGVLAPVIETSELLYSYPHTVDEHTTVILVSRSGETVEVTKLLPILKGRKAAVIGVTNVPGSTLDWGSTQAVCLHSPPDQLVAIQTYTATVIVLLLLGAALWDELSSDVQSELDVAVNALSHWIPECFKTSGDWTSSFLEARSPLYLLGRGASLASVAAGVLLLHEVAKAPAVGMSAANFRHGPVEVVDEQFHAVVFGSERKTVDLDAALAEDLGSMKGDVRWIGPPVSGRKLVPLCPWPANVPDRFAPVFDVIPLQIAAYQLAERRGVIPGEFRYAPAVTVSETGFSGPGSEVGA